MKKIITLTFIIIICLVSNVFCHDKAVVIPLIGATACEGDAVSADILTGKKAYAGGELGKETSVLAPRSNRDRVRDYLRRPKVVAVITCLIIVVLAAIMSRKQGR